MTKEEKEEIWNILNTIMCFLSDINQRLECKVLPNEQRKLQDKIYKALKNMNYFKGTEVKKIMNKKYRPFNDFDEFCDFLGIRFYPKDSYISYRNKKNTLYL